MPGLKVTDAGGGTFRVRVPADDADKEDFEPLHEAARRVLEANLENLIGKMAMSELTPEDRLNWMGFWIGETHEIFSMAHAHRHSATNSFLLKQYTSSVLSAGHANFMKLGRKISRSIPTSPLSRVTSVRIGRC